MRISLKMLLIIFFIFIQSTAFAQTKTMTPAQMHDWIQSALHYGFDMKTTDYTKYCSGVIGRLIGSIIEKIFFFCC